jgi:hypothetical protein
MRSPAGNAGQDSDERFDSSPPRQFLTHEPKCSKTKKEIQMINREEVKAVLDVMENLTDEDVTIEILGTGKIYIRLYPKNWWSHGSEWPEEKRHKILAMVTPLVGKLNKEVDGTHIGYKGEKGNIAIRMNYVDKCKVLGYKTVTKTVKEEVEREPEYVEKEVEERIAITDCDIRQGKFSEDDIEVTA